MSHRGIYLVGSVPLSSAAEVFETVGGLFGSRIRRIPDGETGERSDWITHLEALFRDNPSFERSDEVFSVHATAPKRHRYRLKEGKAPQDVKFGNLGYADNARAAYQEFVRLREAGKIAPGTRLQVEVHRQLDGLVELHGGPRLQELDRLLERIDLVRRQTLVSLLQSFSDCHGVYSTTSRPIERAEPTIYGQTKREMFNRFSSIIAGLAGHVPADIELLVHFCYGDADHRHAIEPNDTGDMVEMANRISSKLKRPIQLIHMPVPRDRSDPAYFAPLRRLALHPETELALGLIHYTDGIEGMRRRMDTARQFVPNYAVATECGFGRRAPHTIPELLRLHLAAADYA